MKYRVWGAFILISAIWGSSFLFIKIGLTDLLPFTLVTVRLGVAVIGLWIILLLTGSHLPAHRGMTILLLAMGLLGVTVPFSLITWGETTIDSGVAGVLNATVPLFTVELSHFTLAGERITLPRLAGLILGFSGVVLIFSRDLQLGTMLDTDWPVLRGQMAVVLSALFYAISSILIRRFVRGVEPLVVSTLQITAAFVCTLAAAMLVESPLDLTMGWHSLFALLWLGLLGTCIAYILFYYILENWGAVRVSLVTYLIPVFAVTLGALVLNERLDWRLILGFLLIVAGIILVNRKGITRRPRRHIDNQSQVPEPSGPPIRPTPSSSS